MQAKQALKMASTFEEVSFFALLTSVKFKNMY